MMQFIDDRDEAWEASLEEAAEKAIARANGMLSAAAWLDSFGLHESDADANCLLCENIRLLRKYSEAIMGAKGVAL